MAQGGIILHSTYADFENGTFLQTEFEDGQIRLKPGALGMFPVSGAFESAEFETPGFTRMVLSWNADTPAKTWITAEATVRVEGVWTDWLKIAKWTTAGDSTSAPPTPEDERGAAFVDVDIITVIGGKEADAYRYRLVFYTEDGRAAPSVRLVAATFRNTLEGAALAAHSPFDAEALAAIADYTGTLNVRPIAQTTRDPQFHTRVCSPVSAAMVLDWRGVSVLPEMAAMGVLDTAYDGYGNWVFNAAFIASYGFASYIEYCAGIEDIKWELMNGNPVITSVRYKQNADVPGDLPIVTNAPIRRTFGHLLVVVGYERGDDGRYYVIVNDPAAAVDGEVRLWYEESEFMAAWSLGGRIAYKTHGRVEGAGLYAPYVEQNTLTPTGRSKTQDNTTFYEYTLGTRHNVRPTPEKRERGISVVIWDEGAGRVYSYAVPPADEGIWLSMDEASHTVYVFTKYGRYFRARVN